MASKAGSEEYLGEKAPAGVPAAEVDKQGLPGRWEEVGRKGREQRIEGEATPVPESGVETPPRPGVGGEPEVGQTVDRADTTDVG